MCPAWNKLEAREAGGGEFGLLGMSQEQRGRGGVLIQTPAESRRGALCGAAQPPWPPSLLGTRPGVKGFAHVSTCVPGTTMPQLFCQPLLQMQKLRLERCGLRPTVCLALCSRRLAEPSRRGCPSPMIQTAQRGSVPRQPHSAAAMGQGPSQTPPLRTRPQLKCACVGSGQGASRVREGPCWGTMWVGQAV